MPTDKPPGSTRGDFQCSSHPSRPPSLPSTTRPTWRPTRWLQSAPPWTDYDVHVIRNADGSYWYTDEGDYACDLSEIEDRIVHTLPGRMHGRY